MLGSHWRKSVSKGVRNPSRASVGYGDGIFRYRKPGYDKHAYREDTDNLITDVGEGRFCLLRPHHARNRHSCHESHCILRYQNDFQIIKQAAAFTEEAANAAESAFRAVQVVQTFALRVGIKKTIVAAFMLGSVYFVAYAANALAFWYGNRLREGPGHQPTEASTIYAVVFLILDASSVVGQFGPFIQIFALAATAGQSVFLILGHPLEACVEKDLQLQDVSFAYLARLTVRVLDDVNLRFQAGKVTRAVSPSSSVESTITSLLFRLYDPSAGRVTLRGKDIKEFNIISLRSKRALVTQHPVLFTGTILDNIKHGLPGGEAMTETEIFARCGAAAVDTVYTRICTRHHSQLSGGQNAMDASSEAVVLEILKKSSRALGHTTIIIAHRLVRVKIADNIVVMKEGAIIEEGPHDALVKAAGVYADLIIAQQSDKKQSFSASSSFVSSRISLQKEDASKAAAQEAPCHWVWLLSSIISGGVIIGKPWYLAIRLNFLIDTSRSSELDSRVALYFFMFFVISLTAVVSHTCCGSAFGLVAGNLAFSKPGHWHHALMPKLNMDSGHLSGHPILLSAVPIMLVAGFLRLRILAKACSATQTVAALGRERDVLRLYPEVVKKPYEESLRFTMWGNIFLLFSLSDTYFREPFIALPAFLFSAQTTGQIFSLALGITRAKTPAQSPFALPDERPSNTTDSSFSISPSNSLRNDLEAVAGSSMPESSKGRLEFRHIRFYYETRLDVLALRNVSFSIRAAILRSSLRLVLLDWRDIRKEPVQEHKATLGLVEQEPDLFPDSVKFNVRLGARPGRGVTHKDVVNVAKKIHGRKLSGGQRQLLAIARVLIRDPEILLLDEATSQLDANTEREVRQAIAAAYSGRTMIMIAHRLASVQHTASSFVFVFGRVMEEGKQDDLVAVSGIYTRMVAAQELD
ncbi:P-loop containing nucleoside triphosphate hydrolase protein [Zopfia rhizophila CBS 207.26]|uniref:P-loop containing nucleoside triphosphate hydrolase protein n=1 Tax=Zopfia rhizophila CBS 207.26 TaxID=1314779 RepID=A0A6A6EFS3_9PEZI|nr:P-loop containing nucleoside triphosphate hydrolase protein [Zopfia rhizophila CBS 207.26]